MKTAQTVAMQAAKRLAKGYKRQSAKAAMVSKWAAAMRKVLKGGE